MSEEAKGLGLYEVNNKGGVGQCWEVTPKEVPILVASSVFDYLGLSPGSSIYEHTCLI